MGALLSLVALALSLAPALDFVRPLALRLAADFYVTDLAVGVPVLLTSTPAATNAHPG